MSIIDQVNAINEQARLLEIQKQDLKCQSLASVGAFQFKIGDKTIDITNITADGDGLMTINYTVDGVSDISRIKNPPILVQDDLGDIVQTYQKEDGEVIERRFTENHCKRRNRTRCKA